ncbi:MAG: hypothetical protein A2252_04950 [Elusimicrobia bacterium RIFOXYA2_FULL_39_19]|nr:MAG: hypothetical protein A2252_04950 [Elusimicrobia bacterium RIFOXYA2_FULL_39_19]
MFGIKGKMILNILSKKNSILRYFVLFFVFMTCLSNLNAKVTISGYVRDESSAPLASVAMNISPGFGLTVSSANGFYSFYVSTGSNYVVTPYLHNYGFIPSSRTYTNLSSTQTNQDFTATEFLPGKISIRGCVKDVLGSWIGGVVFIGGDWISYTSVDSSGNYKFNNYNPGNYVLMVSSLYSSYTFDPYIISLENVNTNQFNQDFVGTSVATNTYAISGYVKYASSEMITGVTMHLSGAKTATSLIWGYYIFPCLPSGIYTVTPQKDGWIFSPESTTITLGGYAYPSFFAFPSTYSVRGYVRDSSSNAVSGALVFLSGSSTGTVITGADGSYAFVSISTGAYTITPEKKYYNFSPANIEIAYLNSEKTDMNFFGVYSTSGYTCSIRGHIRNIQNAELPGISMNLYWSAQESTITANGGLYQFLNLKEKENYVLSPENENYYFIPSSITVLNLENDEENKDFTAISKTINENGSIIETEVVETVGVAGKVVTVTNNASTIKGAQISIPAFAFSTNTIIAIGKVTNPPAAGDEIRQKSSVIDFRAVTGTVMFSTSVVISLPYASDVSNPYSIKAFTYNPVTLTWDKIPTKSINTANKLLSIETNHLSYYVLAYDIGIDLSKVRVYPNPFKPNDGQAKTGTWGQGILFDGLTEKAEIGIYSISGQLVIKLDETDADGQMVWYATNIENEKVASGVYIYSITNNSGDKKTGKLAVIR